ncbi:MAG: tRNA-dihydrouridine synthase 3 [Lasallia pustulata]|uniref:tRNA-dihydrouridine(47) synthase [NAD(P)(+)] n=1 Tax=Lasallia pustulata TaxID=136370 RepID=A0A5M8Q0I1_9LECA|nr:MAG: tRNA-dihydrouridine synthase 3 [Lasallia pustulata]
MTGSSGEAEAMPPNPLDPQESLKPTPAAVGAEIPHPAQPLYAEDSATTKAEKGERHGLMKCDGSDGSVEESPAKRIKLEAEGHEGRVGTHGPTPSERQKGVAPIKAEFLVYPPGSKQDRSGTVIDDDAAEASHHADQGTPSDPRPAKRKEKSRGQNTNRQFGSWKDDKGLCQSRSTQTEFSPEQCRFGDKCKFEHDLRKYLKDYKRGDLTTFGGVCPIWELKGKCDAGWKCRFVGSHMQERDTEDGKKELLLVEKDQSGNLLSVSERSSRETDTVNLATTQQKLDLAKRRTQTPKADAYTDWLEKNSKELEKKLHSGQQNGAPAEGGVKIDDTDSAVKETAVEENRALYTEPPFLPSEKRRIYFGPETPVLAPLTTQGNLPFRRLCVSLGAQLTYSEMAMGMSLIQGQKSEWALMRAHASETTPPAYRPQSSAVENYDNAKDFKFGAQIAANKPWIALKTTEILTSTCPRLRVVDLNCGCPIDLVYRQGAGSALLDSPSKLEKILRGMNAVSGHVPITVKIRMGTKTERPTALKLVDRLVHGGHETLEAGNAPSGVAAITLHGRSRQQRYTKDADWEYIAECAALIRDFNRRGDDLADTVREADARSQPSAGKVFFVGNGDCYSHADYAAHLSSAGVHSVMLARGALIKPWLFEEIASGQYLDKSATERLALVEQYVRFGLETWGSDEMGVGTTRRFLLEWLSFAYRYVPVGLLEVLPPGLQDRPPAWRGRNELETLLGSGDFRDWIKISEMFLGPAHKDFRFAPKHKSNSYEIEAEG